MKKNKAFPALNDYVILFMGFAIIGWLYETFLEVVVYGWGFSNRGLLHGPYLPIYGVGGVIIMLLFYRLIITNPKVKAWLRPILLFIAVVLVSTIIELIASYILEWTTGSWPWQTYENYAIEFGGRIALSTSLRFGLIGLLCAWTVLPLVRRISGKCSQRAKNIAAIVIAAILGVETIIMVIGML